MKKYFFDDILSADLWKQTLRVNKIAMKSFSKICRLESTLNFIDTVILCKVVFRNKFVYTAVNT